MNQAVDWAARKIQAEYSSAQYISPKIYGDTEADLLGRLTNTIWRLKRPCASWKTRKSVAGLNPRPKASEPGSQWCNSCFKAKDL